MQAFVEKCTCSPLAHVHAGVLTSAHIVKHALQTPFPSGTPLAPRHAHIQASCGTSHACMCMYLLTARK
jgi:hypothetical protein